MLNPTAIDSRSFGPSQILDNSLVNNQYNRRFLLTLLITVFLFNKFCVLTKTMCFPNRHCPLLLAGVTLGRDHAIFTQSKQKHRIENLNWEHDGNGVRFMVHLITGARKVVWIHGGVRSLCLASMV